MKSSVRFVTAAWDTSARPHAAATALPHSQHIYFHLTHTHTLLQFNPQNFIIFTVYCQLFIGKNDILK